ncbi:hypothetical protein MHC_03220 [Mycoplasma haemocanis str. Illinois]|uniref:Uncharacterized protein n=1 Tax=Mycoplasma haemocanis (strain Illinois) TaxID=1111676 RepID=H6N782_MYCHN|nr:hypothetical protein [Mycoplasma haemocanis]AEW45504.1 hypothetical protein MHC_03220 [Mycoplasma haemocanis str. Illinois]
MNKLLLSAAGIGGVGAAGLGGYIFSRGKSTPTERTFRTHYFAAILQDNDSIWDSKFKSLKDNGQPTHPKLAAAKTKFSSNAADEEAKLLQKEACREIYDSKLKESNYLSDFKKYCSKTIKDGVTGTWIAEESTDTNKWNPQLTKLKDHNASINKELDSTLRTLKEQLASGSDTQWDVNKRNTLKQWCDSIQGWIFRGNSDSKFIQAQLYCVGT